ncbi:hypothetical protein XI08_02310 [Bradyrhizobium sp. CCBAU 11361]|nr:hypothetical protein [Bradyrhizobium sp. CCBAU 11361]
MKNRRALDDMREIRLRLLRDLRTASGFGSRQALKQVQEDPSEPHFPFASGDILRLTIREAVALQTHAQ